MPTRKELKAYLDAVVEELERPSFIQDDPIAVPHSFGDPLDQEVIGLYAALLAWGRRSTVLAKMADLCERMRFRPYAFVRDFGRQEAERLADFKHRTFQPVDAVALTRALSAVLREFGSLERLFVKHLPPGSPDVGPAIAGFSATVSSIVPETPARLRKHVPSPTTGSACKRLNMYLRWMVRSGPVDFGIWTGISPAQLMLPLDVHSGRYARALGLLERPANDWKATVALTESCRALCPEDPARYDYALFGMGAYGLSLDERFVAGNMDEATSSPTSRYDRS